MKKPRGKKPSHRKGPAGPGEFKGKGARPWVPGGEKRKSKDDDEPSEKRVIAPVGGPAGFLARRAQGAGEQQARGASREGRRGAGRPGHGQSGGRSDVSGGRAGIAGKKQREGGHRSSHSESSERGGYADRGKWQSRRGPKPFPGKRDEGGDRRGGDRRGSDRRRGGFQSPGAQPKKATGVLHKTEEGKFFLSPLVRKIGVRSLRVSSEIAAKFLHQDQLEVDLDDRGNITEVRLIKRRLSRFFAKVIRGDGGQPMLQYRDRKGIQRFSGKGLELAFNEWVVCAYTDEAGVEIKERLGKNVPATRDVEWVAITRSLSLTHPDAAVKEAEASGLNVDEELSSTGKKHRRDLRALPFMTIDGEDARDFDDAVYVEKKGNTHRLWVAIADVSHYVKPGTALDTEAYARATSIYLPERAVHMLPNALSERWCSLRPNEPRASLVACIDFDEQGNKVALDLMEAIIESKRRATYTEVQKEFESGKLDAKLGMPAAFELYEILKQARIRRGTLDMELPEAKILVDEQGEPTEIVVRPRFDSHRLVEEFMIAANEAVTEWARAKRLAFIYRVHEDPDLKKLADLQETAAASGVSFNLKPDKVRESLVKYLKDLEEHPAKSSLTLAMLRSLKQARYTSEYGGHFGLASKDYTHFTSPIRRYPDLIVHRILRAALRGERPPYSEEQLFSMAEHCSAQERTAAEVSRESERLKEVRWLMAQRGKHADRWEAQVLSIEDPGAWVRLMEAPIEGWVPAEAIKRFSKLKIGQKLYVRVLKTDLETRSIDFAETT